jgi:hypothetical protein
MSTTNKNNRNKGDTTMKHLYKQCKNTKEVNAYLIRVGLEGFEFDKEYTFPEEFDFDGWVDETETKGISLQVTTEYEVFICKYTPKDLQE